MYVCVYVYMYVCVCIRVCMYTYVMLNTISYTNNWTMYHNIP